MSADIVSIVKARLPDGVVNAGVRCHESIIRSSKRWRKRFTRLKTWCKARSLKYKKELIIMVKLIGILMFTFDMGTDSFTGVQYINSGKYIGGIVIIIFTILPMLLISLRLVIYSSIDGRNSKNIKCFPSLTATVCSPILPLGWLVLDVVASIGSDDDNDNNNAITEATRLTAEKAAKLIKLFVAVGESYPQTIIQLFIIFGSIAAREYEHLGVWLWISIAVSLISLSISVSTGYLNTEAATSSKVVFFLFGMLAVASRQVVCCVFSMHYRVLWLVPFCTQLVTSIITWSISSRCQGQWAGLLIFILTEAYNSFTLSGLLTSSINLAFAIGGFFLVNLEVMPWVQPVLIVSLVLASVSWTFNVLFTVVPQCKGLRDDWMKKPDAENTEPDAENTEPDAETTEPDAKGALPGAEEAKLDVERTPSEVKDIQPDDEETVTVVVETKRDSWKPLSIDKELLSETGKTRQYGEETQAYDNEILPDDEKNEPNAKEIHIDPRKSASETEETYL